MLGLAGDEGGECRGESAHKQNEKRRDVHARRDARVGLDDGASGGVGGERAVQLGSLGQGEEDGGERGVVGDRARQRHVQVDIHEAADFAAAMAPPPGESTRVAPGATGALQPLQDGGRLHPRVVHLPGPERTVHSTRVHQRHCRGALVSLVGEMILSAERVGDHEQRRARVHGRAHLLVEAARAPLHQQSERRLLRLKRQPRAPVATKPHPQRRRGASLG
mmetsp:Transcript_11719/g.28958  ORF Transcript_11719/g.28958 Transcript_11719/m.28958 type:complete len:221 (+) Transcript_11719:782-1444(+)